VTVRGVIPDSARNVSTIKDFVRARGFFAVEIHSSPSKSKKDKPSAKTETRKEEQQRTTNAEQELEKKLEEERTRIRNILLDLQKQSLSATEALQKALDSI